MPLASRLAGARLGGLPGLDVPGDTARRLAARSSNGARDGAPDETLRALYDRATMGFSVPGYLLAEQVGWDAWLEGQLAPETLDDGPLDAVLALLPTLTMGPAELLATYPDEAGVQVFYELQAARMFRAVYSQKQLFERVVEFWTDHFNVAQDDGLAIWWKTVDDREVARGHAFGSFHDLLLASARSPAMLWYLDNYANVAGTAQENYARELLELHTLGVDGPYTEQDVREVARCFTGWTFHGVYTEGPIGQFVFVPQIHDDGPKQVLGHAIPAGGGVQDGLTVLQILAEHPATAEFVSRKLCRWLLAYEPPQALVQRVKQAYLQTGGDLKVVVRAILQPTSLAAVPAAGRRKLRRPLHFVTSLARSTLLASGNPLELSFALFGLGQLPYLWPAPNGYPDALGAWGSNLLPRWTFAANLFDGAFPSNVPDATRLARLMDTAPAGSDAAAAINWVLSGGSLSAEDEAGVRAYLASGPGSDASRLREAFALAASSPSFQFYG